MFKNFILNLRNSFQPFQNDGTNMSLQNNPKVDNTTTHFKDQTSTYRETKGDKVFYNGFNTIPNEVCTVDLNSNALKSVEVRELDHYESIISSDGELEVTEELANDTVGPSLSQLENLFDKNTCRELDKLFRNKDLNVKMLNSAEKEIFEPVDIPINNNECKTEKLIEDTVELNLLENVIKDQNVTKDSAEETQNTESVTNSIYTDGILDVNNNETPDELRCESNMILKGFSDSEIQVNDEITKTCLKEFNAILNEVQNKDELLFENVDDSIGDFDDIILVEDSDLEIDPISLVDVDMCEEDNTINIIGDEVDKPIIYKSQAKDIISDNSKSTNTSLPKAKAFKTVESNNSVTLKETFTGSQQRIGRSTSEGTNALTANYHEDKSSSDKNVIEIDDDDDNDIISISSEDEMDIRTEHSQLNNSQVFKVKIGSKDTNLVKISTDFMKYLETRNLQNVEKLDVIIIKPGTQITKNAAEKTALENLSLETEESIKSLLINTVKKWNDDSNQNRKQNKTKGKTKIHCTCTLTGSKDNQEDPKNGQDPNNNKAELLNENRGVDENKTLENSPTNMTETNQEHLETISLISEELEIMSTKSDDIDDCGYHSSDFEFITEEEAKKVGLITTYNHENINKYNTRQKHSYATRNTVQNDPYGPGPSNRCSDDSEDRENYVVPDENEIINIFQALPPIQLGEIHYLENKSIQSRVPMLVQYEGVGFDMSLALHGDQGCRPEHRDEAEESMKKILDMYPEDNVITRPRRKRTRMI